MNIVQLNEVGHNHFKKSELDKAEYIFREMISRFPDNPKFHRNLAHTLSHQLNIADAIKEYQIALSLDPTFHGAALDLSLLKLRLGDWKDGWQMHERRHIFDHKEHRKYRYDTTVPNWSGESLVGKTITVQPEAGFGDWIMMLRFLPQLITQADKVYVQAHHQMRVLIQNSFPEVDFIDLEAVKVGEATVMRIPEGYETDYRVLIMSLPLWLNCFFDTMIPVKQYLEPNRKLSQNFVDLNGKIAVTWRGNPDNHTDFLRSALLKDFFPLFETGLQFVSMQKDITIAEKKLLKRFKNVTILSDELIDFNDTACALQEVSCVVGVDTSLINLAGAMGIETHLLSAYYGCWRWGTPKDINTNYSVWYPTVRIWKQDRPASWTHVVKNVVDHLKTR